LAENDEGKKIVRDKKNRIVVEWEYVALLISLRLLLIFLNIIHYMYWRGSVITFL